MEIVEIFAEVLKYVTPALLVLIAVKVTSDAQHRRAVSEQEARIRGEVLHQHLPLRLSAYERAILFLERISPEHLLARISASGKGIDEFRAELVQEIRSEYEHNLAQQLYISPQGWEGLVRAKDEVLGLIHQTAQSLQDEEDARALARKILERTRDHSELTVHKVKFMLKRDIQHLFA
jgi:hypothetical protein